MKSNLIVLKGWRGESRVVILDERFSGRFGGEKKKKKM